MDAGNQITFGLAFFAGFLSFISPCVLPLIPAYISYLGSRATREFAVATPTIATNTLNITLNAGAGTTAVNGPDQIGSTWRIRIATLIHALFFVAGFTVIFVIFGLFTNAGIQSLRATSYNIQILITQLGGLLIIFFGLHVLGLSGWVLRVLATEVEWKTMGKPGEAILRGLERMQGALYSDTRRQMNPRNSLGYIGSALMGVVFAAGWTPCIGPIYGGILTMASTATRTGESGQVALLLVAYSLGLGMPFLLTAIMLDRMRGFLNRIKKQMRLVEIISGVFLIVIGVLLVTNRFSYLNQMASGLADFSYNVEECSINVMQNEMPSGDLLPCINLGPREYENSKKSQKPSAALINQKIALNLIIESSITSIMNSLSTMNFS